MARFFGEIDHLVTKSSHYYFTMILCICNYQRQAIETTKSGQRKDKGLCLYKSSISRIAALYLILTTTS